MLQSYMVKVLRVGEPELSVRVNSTHLACRYWNAVIKKQPWFDDNKEHVVALLLSTRYEVHGYSLVSIGSLNEAAAHPREIFRAAVASGSYAIILMHNHPSGDPYPSAIDHSLTQRIEAAAGILQIELCDHIIIGRRRRTVESWEVKTRLRRRSAARARANCMRCGYFSFKEAGAL